MTREDVFRIIEVVDQQVLAEQARAVAGISRIEHVVPFVDGDFSLSIWAFYETEEELRAAREDGRASSFQLQYLDALRANGYAPAWLEEVDFTFDSAENVEENFDGSYFYRLR